ncbi:MAG: DUF1353 domain-containing protein [Anaerolineae bacterium]|nr:DUF1353 domain-containing protein [Anaerolineae bacterium]MCB1870322.1 DUF1353 domain-containing protein [Gammaproteobacteria bacterium]
MNGLRGFNNSVKVEWLQGREMRLLEDVTYTDAAGVEWTAHAGDVIDGASIPRLFWRFIGCPFVGEYRNASVIHDVYCQRKAFLRPSKTVHQVFYDAMIFEGCPRWKAKLMHNAVKLFGPRW